MSENMGVSGLSVALCSLWQNNINSPTDRMSYAVIMVERLILLLGGRERW